MPNSDKWVRTELNLLGPLLTGSSIDASRIAQDKIGALMASTQRSRVSFTTQVFKDFVGEWALPKKPVRTGVILYLHGGGYVAGNLEYAKGFGSVLAARHGIRVFCPAYRLAPEFPFPAALEDSLASYKYLLSCGYSGSSILLCGESAGGGLVFALAARLYEEGLELPCGLVPISPWCDLTLSGSTYQLNRDNDPLLTFEQLGEFRRMYGGEPTDPMVSPLFADLSHCPPVLMFAGGDEILLDDAVRMHKKLRDGGCDSTLFIARRMWHAYILYGVRAAQRAHSHISEFLDKYMGQS